MLEAVCVLVCLLGSHRVKSDARRMSADCKSEVLQHAICLDANNAGLLYHKVLSLTPCQILVPAERLLSLVCRSTATSRAWKSSLETFHQPENVGFETAEQQLVGDYAQDNSGSGCIDKFGNPGKATSFWKPLPLPNLQTDCKALMIEAWLDLWRSSSSLLLVK